LKLTLKAALCIGGLALFSLGGCATEKFVRQQVAGEDDKVRAAQTANDAKFGEQGQRMDQLDKTSKDALDRAIAAGKLAEGKFLYSMVLSDDSVKFPTNSSELSPEAQARLTDFANKLKGENKNVYLEIQGHTDSKGAHALNQRLGQDRADAVRLFLNKQGVALNRMSTISYADSAPVAPNTTKEGRAQNRRVVVIVLA
jgi:peptidoglycan-associated lipoprotein